MPLISCPDSLSINDNNLNERYPNGVLGVYSDVDHQNGMLKQSKLDSIIGTLSNNGVIPSTNVNADVYKTKVEALLQKLQEEFCFYEQRYKFVLTKLFEEIRKQTVNQNTVNTFLNKTREINTTLNDLTQIVQRISTTILNASTILTAEIINLNKGIEENKAKLAKQNEIINSGQAAIIIRKQMVNYSEEKSRYSNNLLNLYSVLNVVVLGLLVYVYKAASD